MQGEASRGVGEERKGRVNPVTAQSAKVFAFSPLWAVPTQWRQREYPPSTLLTRHNGVNSSVQHCENAPTSLTPSLEATCATMSWTGIAAPVVPSGLKAR